MTNEQQKLTPVDEIRMTLAKQKEAFENRLIKNGRTFEDFCQEAIDYVRSLYSSEISNKLSTESILRCITKASKINLPLGGNLSSFVPFGNNLQYMIGYEGYAILLSKYTKIKFSDYFVIYEGDIFDFPPSVKSYQQGEFIYHANFTYTPTHKSKKTIGAFAFVLLASGQSYGLKMDVEELNKFRAGKSNLFWKNWEDKMYAKTCYKELLRYLTRCFAGVSADIDILQQVSDDENAEMKDINSGIKEKPALTTGIDIIPSKIEDLL